MLRHLLHQGLDVQKEKKERMRRHLTACPTQKHSLPRQSKWILPPSDFRAPVMLSRHINTILWMPEINLPSRSQWLSPSYCKSFHMIRAFLKSEFFRIMAFLCHSFKCFFWNAWLETNRGYPEKGCYFLIKRNVSCGMYLIRMFYSRLEKLQGSSASKPVSGFPRLSGSGCMRCVWVERYFGTVKVVPVLCLTMAFLYL